MRALADSLAAIGRRPPSRPGDVAVMARLRSRAGAAKIEAGGHAMSDAKVEVVRSRSSGVVGRAISNARNHHFVLDSSTAPEAVSNSEAFLAGVSSCGVTLVEGHARDRGVSLQRMEVTIEGVRAAAEPNRFQRVAMRFELYGVDQATAEALVDTYKAR
jgi:uncharacterized OsmC-like protein